MITANTADRLLKILLWASAFAIILVLFSIMGYVFLMGAGVMNLEFIFTTAKNNWKEGGIITAIEGTLIVVSIAVLFAAPIGIGAAIYLAEFTREGKTTKIIRLAADSLNAIPSIVFGLFGLTLFIHYLKDYTGGASLLSAGLTLSFMILPTIMRTSEVSIRTVPLQEKMGSYALGATKLQTVKNIVIPGALPGIFTGIILSLGRAAGETAPIVFMTALNPITPSSIFRGGNALTTTLYYLTSEGISINRAFGIALTLILIVLTLNYSARFVNNYLTRNQRR
ncbi:MAG: phosphate ABC transporter permease PstA [Candidatus Altiarchaeota archaeon]|nr:phosphate ABC transporter permease PstA [Candidatus Altiarchaeota archaeon]